MFTHTVVHYGEIALKGKNRPDFEKKLVDNIRCAIGKEKVIKRLFGRIIIDSSDSATLNSLKNAFGVAHFSPCVVADLDMDDIKQKALRVAKSIKPANRNSTFKIDTTRGNKSFQLTSMQTNERVGDIVNEKMKWKVNLTDPDVIIYVEVAEKNAFIYTEKVKGLGGLPVGVTGKVVCLLSGGIDSPVAAWYAMKRGCSVVFVHFHTYTSKIENKLEPIVRILSKYQANCRLYLVPFYETQENIIKNVPDKFRMLLYRKMMFRIAEEILKKEGALAFVTGDNIAQVASQTLENLNVIYSAANYPIFAPLIGFDKKEIIKVAEQIGTYSSSIIPYKDCCSFMVVNPATRAKRDDVEMHEKTLEIEKLVENAVKKAEVRDIKS